MANEQMEFNFGSSPYAKIIEDSVSEQGIRLTTMEVKFHHFVLAQFNTHRVFSRNSASSRAIPIEKRLKEVLEDPAIPLHWGLNRPGMQAWEEVGSEEAEKAKAEWLAARDAAVSNARNMAALGIHKQVVNRLIEPFLWHTVVVTATDWENFFHQRCSPLAQPEIRAVADEMKKALEESKPRVVLNGGWHLPYVIKEERQEGSLTLREMRMMSTARCARVSYLTHDGLRDIQKDFDRYQKLVTADPIHSSPLEHVATPAHRESTLGNFRGWHQLRHLHSLHT